MHLRSLISAFEMRLFKSITSRLVSVAVQAGLNHTLSEILKTGFLGRGPYFSMMIKGCLLLNHLRRTEFTMQTDFKNDKATEYIMFG